MKKVLYIMFALSVLGAVSCTMPVADQTEYGQMAFGAVDLEDPQGELSAGLGRGTGATGATQVRFSYTGPRAATGQVLKLINFGGNLLSEYLELPVGTYQLTQFELLNATGQVVYVTPLAGSKLAYLVSTPLSRTFTVAKNVQGRVKPDVISTAVGVPGDFGYTGVDFAVIPTFDALFQVQAPLAADFGNVEARLSIMVGTVPYYSGNLTAGLNQITLKETAGTYTVTISREGYDSFSGSYTLAEMKAFLNVPLMPNLYPHASYTGYVRLVSSSSNGGGGFNVRFHYADGSTEDRNLTMYITSTSGGSQLNLRRTDVLRVESRGGGGGGDGAAVHTLSFSMDSGAARSVASFNGTAAPATGTILWQRN